MIQRMSGNYRTALVTNGDGATEQVDSLMGTSRLSNSEVDQVIDRFSRGEELQFNDTLGISDKFIARAAMWSTHIQEIVSREKKMLHPSKETILRSFLEGRAAFYLVQDASGGLEAVGYCRLIPLLSEKQRADLHLPAEFPHLYELGTVIVDQQCREHGVGTKVVGAVHQMNLAAVQQQEALIIGTTTTYRMMKVLKNMMKTPTNPNGIGLGIPFVRVSPITEGVEYIGATTCICSPHDVAGVQLGQESLGMHYGYNACTVRTQDRNTYRLGDTPDGEIFPFAEGGCMMFVSDIDLAKRANSLLAQYSGMTVEQVARYLQN